MRPHPSAIKVCGDVGSLRKLIALWVVRREGGQHEHPRILVGVEGSQASEGLLEELVLIFRPLSVREVLIEARKVPKDSPPPTLGEVRFQDCCDRVEVEAPRVWVVRLRV